MNKITCICLGVRSMQRALKFYREGLGYETDCKDDNPPVCFFNTLGTNLSSIHWTRWREISTRAIRRRAADLLASR